jgi:Ca2+-binding RTX toxin-like protein
MALLTSQTNAFSHVRMDAASVTVTNAPSTVTDLQLTAANTTLASFDRLVDGSANSLNVYATAANTATTLTVDDEETLTFDVSDATLTITNFNAEDATSITVSGDNAINLGTYAATTANLATFDASGMTSAANASLTATASTVAMTVTGNASTAYTGVLTVSTGNGNDTITGGNGADVLTAGAGNDTITGGAGADTITGGAGADTITGGAGVDIFVFTQPSAQANSIDTIKDFTANSTNTSDDRIRIDLITGANTDATSMHEENSGGEVLDDGDVYVLTGDSYIDVSGNAAADKTAILAAGGGLTISSADGVEALAIFKADTDGDGTADEVQLWLLESTAANATINAVYHLATFEGYSTTLDLASDFAVGDFDL